MAANVVTRNVLRSRGICGVVSWFESPEVVLGSGIKRLQTLGQTAAAKLI